jgi:predicted aspartyl protease
VVAINVDSGPSGGRLYIDGAFASVTFCEPKTSNCQTVDHLLIDTGSVGVRVLESKIKLNLPAATSTTGKNLAECLPFLSGTSWGPVRVADVKIGGETASNLRIQLIGETTYALAADCSGTPINDLTTLGSNGILGVGLYVEDCGTACASQTQNPGLYYACTTARTGGCAVTTLPVANQIANPIATFPDDNNGSSIQLPSIPENGAQSVSGLLVFGIGTRSNNALGSANVIQSDANGLVKTTFPVGGTAYDSIIDSGSNGLYFLNSATTKLTACTSSGWAGFYCPQTTTALGASLRGKDGSAVSVTFSVANASKFPSQNCAFSTVGAPMTGYPTDPTIPGFDWGLPFYFGRTVFTALETKNTPAGTGPYFAF